MQVTTYTPHRPTASGTPRVAYHWPMARPDSRQSVARAPSHTTPLSAALARIGDRWSPRIVEALLTGPMRYGDLQFAVAGIAPNILAERLRRLEVDGLLVATAYVERPPRFEYRLTTEGRSLAGALRLLADGGAALDPSTGEHASLRHDACGTAREAHWFCPTCDAVVDGPSHADGRRV